MAFLHFLAKAFTYPEDTPEEARFRRVLSGATLEFGEPHAFESGTVTRPLLEDKKGRITAQPTPRPTAPLEYSMLQEDGLGFTIFGAMRTTYAKTTPVEPIRFAVQFVTTSGTVVVDVAVPSRYALNDKKRNRSYDEKIGSHMRISVLSRTKGVGLENIILAFAANKNVPIEDFKPLITVIREQGEAKKPVFLKPAQLRLLTNFITAHFGDYSDKLPPDEALFSFEEIIPETPEEVAKSDGWVRGIASAIESNREPDSDKSASKPDDKNKQ